MRTVWKCTIRIFLRISYFVCGFYNSNSFYIPLFHSYKKFLVFNGCILYIVSNFIQIGKFHYKKGQ